MTLPLRQANRLVQVMCQMTVLAHLRYSELACR